MPDNKCNECGHQHDHDHDYDEMDNIIELTGENGETIQVEFLATVKVDDQEYAIMQTLDYDDEDEAEVVIMRLEYDGNDDEYYLIAEEDEDVQQRVFDAFQKAALEEEE
ncbi:MAG TPA: DUF1292 domain-containing protein [Thermoclostridium sp.]